MYFEKDTLKRKSQMGKVNFIIFDSGSYQKLMVTTIDFPTSAIDFDCSYNGFILSIFNPF
jgi:hypothetical protein